MRTMAIALAAACISPAIPPAPARAYQLEGSVPLYVSCYLGTPDNVWLNSPIFRVGRGALYDEAFDAANKWREDLTTGISVHGTPGEGTDITAQWQEILAAEGLMRPHRGGCALGRSVQAFLKSRADQLRNSPTRRFDDRRFAAWMPKPGIRGNYVAEVWDWNGVRLSSHALGRAADSVAPSAVTSEKASKPAEQGATTGGAPAPASRQGSEADARERTRTEQLNQEIAERNAALLAENTARRQQFADAQVAHQRGVEAAEAERRAHEEALARKQVEVAEFRRGLEAYQQSLREGRFKKAEAEANARRAEEQLKATKAEEQRLAELKRKADKRNAPIDFKEGVVLCEKPRSGGRSWRCQGPLQITYGELDTPSGQVALRQACGTDRPIRDLGTAGSYRAFGCGFGIHPTASDYPGNTDVAARLGVFVDGRATFRCPRSKLAYCRDR